MNVIATLGSDTATRVYSGSVETLNLNGSNFGDNCTLTELDRLALQSGGVLLACGDGTTAWFASTGGGNLTSPAGSFASMTLTQLGDNTYRLTDKLGNKANFSTTGLLTSRVDHNGNTTAFVYVDSDSDSVVDELSTISDPWSLVTTFAYTSGLLASVSDHAGRVTTIGQDSQGRITSITAPDPDGAGSLAAPVTAYAYSGTTRRLASVTDPLNHVTSVSYDFAGRASQITDAANGTNSFTVWQRRGLPDLGSGQGTQSNPMPLYSATLNDAQQTNSLNNTFPTRYDRFGLFTSYKDPLTNVSTWQRDANGLTTQLTQPDPDGAGSQTSPITSFQYDAKQNLTQVTLPGGATQSWVYHSTLNVPTSATNELSKTTTFTYDSVGNLLTTTTPLGFVTTSTYNSRASADRDGSRSGRRRLADLPRDEFFV
jgi:YD repeat-containing protein